MNRVLSIPHTPIYPGMLDGLKAKRSETTVTDKGMVRFDLPFGPVEMKFSIAEHQLAPGTDVVVWWNLGGFVCAPAAELVREADATRQVTQRVMLARAQLAKARVERRVRLASHCDLELDDIAEPLRTA